MKYAPLCVALLLTACSNREPRNPAGSNTQEEDGIQKMVFALYDGLERAYNSGGVDTDSLIDAYFEKDIRYVTPWGWTEPLDTTKYRLRHAISHVKEYYHRVEALHVKSYGAGAYAFFILRQNYVVDGKPLDEYLPTTLVFERRGDTWKIVHAHRSTDYETFQQYVSLQQRPAK